MCLNSNKVKVQIVSNKRIQRETQVVNINLNKSDARLSVRTLVAVFLELKR